MPIQAAHRWHLVSRVKHFQMRGWEHWQRGSLVLPPQLPIMQKRELRTPPPGGGLFNGMNPAGFARPGPIAIGAPGGT
jgi:hypothetical protein